MTPAAVANPTEPTLPRGPAWSRIRAAFLCAAGALYSLFIFRTTFRVGDQIWFTLVDDAMISMRYARNLATGHGLVWNPGQPPVEGFTNLGWTGMMVLAHLLGLPESLISLPIMVFGAFVLLVNAILVARLTDLIAADGGFAGTVGLFLAAFSFSVVFWTLRGMEVGLLASLVTASVLMVIDRDRPSRGRRVFLGLALASAVVIRLDALLLVMVIFGLAAIAGGGRSRLNAVATPAALVVATTVGVLAFQRLYYGDWLPNTYHLKVGGASAMERLEVGFNAFATNAAGEVLLLLVIGMLGTALWSRKRALWAARIVALPATACIYSLYVGGDYAEPQVHAANRFIAPAMGCLVAVYAAGLAGIGRRSAEAVQRLLPSVQSFMPRASLAGVVAVVLSILSAFAVNGRAWTDWAENNAPLLESDIWRARRGLLLRQGTDPNAVVAVHACGQIPYYSQRNTIDLLGKSDRIVAHGAAATSFRPGHNKWNYSYSIGQLGPDLVADRWGHVVDYMRDDSRYIELPNGIFVLRSSTHVKLQALSRPSTN